MPHTSKNYLPLAIFAILALAVVIFLTRPQNEDTKLGRAADEISEGFRDAGRELDPNRTTGEKIGDAIEDVGEDIQDASDNH